MLMISTYNVHHVYHFSPACQHANIRYHNTKHKVQLRLMGMSLVQNQNQNYFIDPQGEIA